MDLVEFTADKITAKAGPFNITNVSFSIKSGDILGVVGRSGAGKSTVIRQLISRKKPVSGSITVKINNVIANLHDIIGYSPQDNALYPFLSLEENLITFGELHNVKKKDILQKADFLYKRLDLRMSKHKKIRELSGGMQKRADLAASLIHDPQVLILDEPFSGLDISLQTFIWTLLKELSLQGKVIIVSSHMLGDIQKYCNHFGLVESGTFYNTRQINRTMKLSKQRSLEGYLEKLFTRDIIEEETKK
tara:strand:+ start:1961 stop:2704 length:744 start_codon:yes stop_codon:yes gene_type:complete